jgi:diadenosine tetraphosphate (Ap4A) HIT family hydrolase
MKNSEQECPFCDEVKANTKSKDPRWIADLKVSTAKLASNQICRGYTILIYSKAHATELFQLGREDLTAYSEDLARVAKAIYKAYNPHKINYELLGNAVPHLHWHVIPRQKTDPIDLHWPIWGKDYRYVRLSDDEYGQIADKIRTRLF